jgi:DNA processing protein
MLATMKLWIWLSLSCAPRAAWQAWKHFGSVERVYAADQEELRAVPGLREEHVERLCRKSTERAERILGRCDELGIRVLCWEDENYPQRLRELFLPPMVLYQWGLDLNLGEECAVAMAGTRRCSPYGRSMAEHFSRDLTRQGAVVVTGMAGGCDEAALRAALREGGPVAALLPGGVDVPFEDNAYYRSLYRDVRQMGVLVSPYPPGTSNDHHHFAYRNPLLTGITVATLCVESGVRSGVLNVASHANEQHRPLYVVPANLDSVSAAGTNALLCEGIAMPVMSAADILLPFQASYPQLHLGTRTGSVLRSKGERKGDSKAETQGTGEEKKVDTDAPDQYIDLQTDVASLTEEERSVLTAMAEGEKTAEELSALCQLSGAQTLSTLTLLTLRGAVEELGGGRFRALVRIKEEQQE